MSRLALRLFSVFALLGAACGGPDKPAHVPQSSGELIGTLGAAFREEATGSPIKAVDLYVRALDGAATSPENPWSVGIMMASLDALVHRGVSAFADITQTSALTDRIDPETLHKTGGTVDERLARVAERAEGPFAAHLVLNARLELAERRGDVAAAQKLRPATGCIQEALLLGPTAWTPVSSVHLPGAFPNADSPVPAELDGPGPFDRKVRPSKVRGYGCQLPLYADTSAPGVREVVVDVEVKEKGRIGVGMHARGAATMRVGGKLVIDRPYSVGGDPVARFATVDVQPGMLRLVARVGMDRDFGTLELGAWDENGAPLRAVVPAAGNRANARADKGAPVATPEPKSGPERVAFALGALAAHENRAAEDVLYKDVESRSTAPESLIVYARAVRLARDLPMVKSQERARTAYERVLEAWPTAWEAIVEHAVLAGARRGQAEAPSETLTDIEKSRNAAKNRVSPLVDALEAEVAGRGSLYDRASAAYERARPDLSRTLLLRAVERVAFDRTGTDAVAFDCDPKSASDRTSLACHRSRVAIGDRAGAEAELDRLRALSGSSQFYLSLSSRNALETGDLPRAKKIFDAMNQGDRQLSTLYAIKGKAAVPELLSLAKTARDAPSALAALMRDAGDDPATVFDGVAERVTSSESGGALLANAATAVLAHEERYDVAANGLVHFVMLDVRRVMGTTDVESNAQANAPMVFGRDTVRILRRRILKKDGRILLPDRTPNASQSHADLSQLETGDAVEAIYEGFGVPGEMGNIGIDTPDLLPERTAVRDARIEIRMPAGLPSSLWSHPMLGRAEERTENGTRTLVWKMKDHSVRRIEYGVPKMDRNVGVSFSTTTWDDVAKGSRENIASLDASSPEVSDWARAALEKAGPQPTQAAIVGAVVAASGDAVKEAAGSMLGDVELGRAGQPVTARTMLATHEGSRTWLIVRALRDLGITADIVLAENDPFSDSPTFPPHFGRFMHPLAVVHLTGGKGAAGEDMWIDADIPGPPLPAGRISPELRGRMALFPDGTIKPLPVVASTTERDEIDERITVDEHGNAKGVLTVLLRGRAAQDLAEALIRIVGNERQRALRGIALAWVPFATVEKVELSSSEGSWQVAIRAELTAPAYALVEGTKPGTRTWVLPGIDPVHSVFPRPYVSTLGSTYATHAARENALAVSRATQYHVRRRIELPPKAQIVALPGPFDGTGPLFVAQRKVSVADNTIEEDFLLDVATGTVPREGYDAFVKEVHRTDDAFRAGTRVKPPSP